MYLLVATPLKKPAAPCCANIRFAHCAAFSLFCTAAALIRLLFTTSIGWLKITDDSPGTAPQMNVCQLASRTRSPRSPPSFRFAASRSSIHFLQVSKPRKRIATLGMSFASSGPSPR